MNKKKIIIYSSIVVAIILSVLFAIGTTYYHYTYGDVDAEQLFFTLTEPLSGTDNTTYNNIVKFVVVPVVIASIFALYMFFSSHNGFTYKSKSKIARIISVCLVVAMLLSSTIWFVNGFNAIDFIKYQYDNGTFIEENYIDSKKVNITFPENKKNLILIYVESMETSFTSVENGGCMSVDIIPELAKLAKENVHFSNTDKLGGALETVGTTWTTAGIVASTFGIPLKAAINSYGENTEFLPNVYSLYDILDANGYYQVSMKGAPVEFGGVEKMLSTHKLTNYIDHTNAIKMGLIPEDYVKFWGYEDMKLFEFAKDELTKISQKEEPFFLMMETIDTHMPSGFACDKCTREFGDKYSNVLRCSSRQVAEFVEWCQQQDWYEDTTIVLLGDHLTMVHTYLQNVGNYQRTTYNCFINSFIQSNNTTNRQFSTIDMFPTILASIGCEIEGDRLGLGTNLFSKSQTLVEEYGIDYINKEFKKKSMFYLDELM